LLHLASKPVLLVPQGAEHYAGQPEAVAASVTG